MPLPAFGRYELSGAALLHGVPAHEVLEGHKQSQTWRGVFKQGHSDGVTTALTRTVCAVAA